jgi:hypothetical protein
MALGVTDHVWSIDELIQAALIEPLTMLSEQCDRSFDDLTS